MSSHPQTAITASEYLVRERKSDSKWEFYRGEVFAMGGASRAHNRITANMGAIFNQQFRDRNCEEFVSDMRVKIESDGSYVYPDVVATCLPPQFEDQELDTLINPQLIVEVLSDSTESYDRGKKFERYRTIETLTDYLLVAQDRVSVDYFQRDGDRQWFLRGYNQLSDVIRIASLDCKLAISDIYLKVEFEAEQ